MVHSVVHRSGITPRILTERLVHSVVHSLAHLLAYSVVHWPLLVDRIGVKLLDAPAHPLAAPFPDACVAAVREKAAPPMKVKVEGKQRLDRRVRVIPRQVLEEQVVRDRPESGGAGVVGFCATFR